MLGPKLQAIDKRPERRKNIAVRVNLTMKVGLHLETCQPMPLIPNETYQCLQNGNVSQNFGGEQESFAHGIDVSNDGFPSNSQ